VCVYINYTSSIINPETLFTTDSLDENYCQSLKVEGIKITKIKDVINNIRVKE